MSTTHQHHDSQCYPLRVELAAAHVDRGEWACGLAIANGLIKCSTAGGCPRQGDCGHAAQRMMSAIKTMLNG